MAKSVYAAARLAAVEAEHEARAARLGVYPRRDSPSDPRRGSPMAGIARRLSPYQLTLAGYVELYKAHNGQCRLCHAIVRSIIPDRFDCKSRRGPGAGTAQIALVNGQLMLLCRSCYTGLKVFEMNADRLREAAELCSR